MVNWSSNSPFRGMILATRSLSTNINRSKRVIIGIQISSTECIVVRRNHSLLVIGVRHHIGGVINDEHEMIGAEPNSDGSDGWILILVRIDPFECAVGGWALDEHGMVHFPLITKRHFYVKQDVDFKLRLIFRTICLWRLRITSHLGPATDNDGSGGWGQPWPKIVGKDGRKYRAKSVNL